MRERIVSWTLPLVTAMFLTLGLWVVTDQRQQIRSLEVQLAVAQAGVGIQIARTKIADAFYEEMRAGMKQLLDK